MIPDPVTLDVVDLLEAVEIEEQHRQPGPGLCRLDQHLGQAVRQRHAVEQPGQGIRGGQQRQGACIALALQYLALQIGGAGFYALLQELVGIVQRDLGSLHPALMQDRLRRQQLVAARQADERLHPVMERLAGDHHDHGVEQPQQPEDPAGPVRLQQEHQREGQDQAQAVAAREAEDGAEHDRTAPAMAANTTPAQARSIWFMDEKNSGGNATQSAAEAPTPIE